MEKLSLIELAELICAGTYAEALRIIEGTKECKFTNVLERLSGTKSKIFSKIFYELLAYYQFLVLITVFNVFGIEGEAMNRFGGELNRTLDLIAKDEKKLYPHVKKAVSNPPFHNLVGSYLSDDRSISNLNKKSLTSLLKITGFDRFTDDFIKMSYIISYSRLLRTLGFTRGDSLIRNFKMLALWFIHADFVNSFRQSLSKYLKETYPDKFK